MWLPIALLALSMCLSSISSRTIQSLHRGEESDLRPSDFHTSRNSTGPTPNEKLKMMKELATMFYIDVMLQKLGPEYRENLPQPPNHAIPTVVTPLNLTTDHCPETYSRCSSVTFFNSCTVPKNTNTKIWSQKFNLYFNLSGELLGASDHQLLNATVRLYKHLSIPLSEPTDLTVELHAYNRSLTKRRDRRVLISSTTVRSDYIGWVFLDVVDHLRELKPRKNYGFLVTVRDEQEDIEWNAPELFVTMECSNQSSSLTPLPFEVETDDQSIQIAQRYPALNIRTGVPEVFFLSRETAEVEDEEDDGTPFTADKWLYGKKNKKAEKTIRHVSDQPMYDYEEVLPSSRRMARRMDDEDNQELDYAEDSLPDYEDNQGEEKHLLKDYVEDVPQEENNMDNHYVSVEGFADYETPIITHKKHHRSSKKTKSRRRHNKKHSFLNSVSPPQRSENAYTSSEMRESGEKSVHLKQTQGFRKEKSLYYKPSHDHGRQSPSLQYLYHLQNARHYSPREDKETKHSKAVL